MVHRIHNVQGAAQARWQAAANDQLDHLTSLCGSREKAQQMMAQYAGLRVEEPKGNSNKADKKRHHK